MPSTFFGLNIGLSGLYTYQAGLNTTAHNVANTETKGYTRQIVNQSADNPLRVNSSYGMAGTGVVVTGIEQARNQYYDLKYRANNTMFGEYDAKYYYMKEIENNFNDVTMQGFTTSYNSLFASLQGLSTDSASLTKRTEVVNYAKSLTEYFNNQSNSLKSIQEECNFEIKNQVDSINSLAQQISAVTKQINTLESGGGIANDLRDRRELLIDDLSKIVNVSVSEHVVGNDVGVTSFVVKIDGQTLVNTDSYNTLKVVQRDVKQNQSDVDGLYDIQWGNGQNFNPQTTTIGGYLQSLFQVRDGNNKENFKGTAVDTTVGDNVLSIANSNVNAMEKLNIPSEGIITIDSREYKYTSFEAVYDSATKTYQYNFTMENAITADMSGKSAAIGDSVDYKGIPYYMSQVNELVRTFAKEFNNVHKQGEDLKGEKGIDFFNGTHPVTGENYSLDTVTNGYYNITAGNFTITAAIYKDPNKIVTSSKTVASGSPIEEGVEKNDILNKLLALKGNTSMFKQGTPASFFQTIVAEVGVDSKKSEDFAKNQTNILSMVKNQRLSVSGVDSDEEGMNMVMYQRAYNLSSKVISIMNEIYDKLINGTAV
jgi:flagellar hook-associated protein 1 FlgK